jgi:hypothetical protein
MTTVAAFGTPVEAELARNRLEQEGITAFVVDAEAVGMLWRMGGALGGVKVQVVASAATRARAILGTGRAKGGRGDRDDYGLTPAVRRGSPPPQRAPARDADEEDESESDATAARAWRSAVIGLLLLPPLLHFYAAWLLFQLPWTRGPLSPAGRWKALGAAVVTVLAVAGVILVLRALVLPQVPAQDLGRPGF